MKIFFISCFNNSISKSTFRGGINESWAHDLQILSHLYSKDTITAKLLKQEIKKIFMVIDDKSKVKGYTKIDHLGLSWHLFMQSFMCLFGALILTDIILRKQGMSIKHYLRKAFTSSNIHQIYLITIANLEKIENDEFKVIIYKRLIDKSLIINKKIKFRIIKAVDYYFVVVQRDVWKGVQSTINKFSTLLYTLTLLDPANQGEVDKFNLKMERKLENFLNNYFAGATNEIKKLVANENSSVAKLEKLFEHETHLAEFLKANTT